MPVIRLQELVERLPSGDEVEVVGTDPGVLSDIPSWCRVNGHHVLETVERGDEILIMVKVGEAPSA